MFKKLLEIFLGILKSERGALGANHAGIDLSSSGSTGNSQEFIPEIWSKDVLKDYRKKLVAGALCLNFSDQFGAGDRMEIPSIASMTVQTKAKNTEVVVGDPDTTSQVLYIDNHKYVAFLLEDPLKIQSKYDYRRLYTNRAGYEIAKDVDTALLALYADATHTVGTYGTPSTDETEIVNAVYELDNADVPDEDRYAIIHPKLKQALLKSAWFTESQYIPFGKADSPQVTGKVGQYIGVDFHVSNNVPVTSATPDQYHNIVFQKDAFVLAQQILPRVQAEYMLNYLGTLVVVDVLYGKKTLRADNVVEWKQ